MLSLYLHIPFCAQKCAYCSFASFPIQNLSSSLSPFKKGRSPQDRGILGGGEGNETKDFPTKEGGLVARYLAELKKEIAHYGEIFPGEEIKTIYIGGGTPNLIGAENIISIIDEIKKYFNTESVAEYSFEFNPFPQDEIYAIVKKLNATYAKESRVRFSFGIQSLDDKVLESADRPSSFGQIVNFLRGLQEYKQENNVFNFDFIAFGKFNETRSGNLQLRDQSKLKFFENLAQSGFADSFSLYTLELSEGSKRYSNPSQIRNLSSSLSPFKKGRSPQDRGILGGGEGNETEDLDDLISEEYQILKEILLEAGYHRYEISNFAHPSKNSIHNMAYRTMENYLGLGLAASSFLDKEHAEILSSFLSPFTKGRCPQDRGILGGGEGNETKDFGLRFTNTKNLNEYLTSKRLNETDTIEMTRKDYLIEKFFLNFRTNQGIKDIVEFKEILVPNYETKIKNYINQGFIASATRDPQSTTHIRLTDAGMDVFNIIITDLMQEI